MFGSSTLEIVIGLIFVFLLYSLFATILLEIVATWMGMRARLLEKAIIRMLNDGQTRPVVEKRWWMRRLVLTKWFFWTIWDRMLSFFLITPESYRGSFAYMFYDQPSIKYLSEDAWHSKPAYITQQNFSKAVIELLRGDDIQPGDDISERVKKILFPVTEDDHARLAALQIPEETLKLIRSLLIDAGCDIDLFRNGLEKWFTETMERATGWYKRHIQIFLFVIGFGMAVLFNADSLRIAANLSKDKSAREHFVQLASNSEKYNIIIGDIDTSQKRKMILYENDSTQKKLNEAFRLVKDDLESTNHILGLGWKIPYTKSQMFCANAFKNDKSRISLCKSCMNDLDGKNDEKLSWYSKIIFILKTQVSWHVLLGWIITALAISLGAPFWFDLLNKVMKVRGSGSKPHEAISASVSVKAKAEG